jgi:hypothetical protein
MRKSGKGLLEQEHDRRAAERENERRAKEREAAAKNKKNKGKDVGSESPKKSNRNNAEDEYMNSDINSDKIDGKKKAETDSLDGFERRYGIESEEDLLDIKYLMTT